MPYQSWLDFYQHLPPGQGGCSDCYTTRLNSITLLFARLPGIFIAEIFRELVLFYPRSLLEDHVLVVKKAMESANIIHLISHELFT